MPDPKMDRLTSQLSYLPTIIGRMGISIAEAQTLLNADYVRTLANVLILINKAATAGPGVDPQYLTQVASTVLPCRYEFTETTLDFSADLAERLDVGVSAGLGLGLTGFTVNAGLSMSFGYDYRAAARVTAKIHSVAADKETRDAMLARAKELHDVGMTLPDRSLGEDVLWKNIDNLRQLTGGPSMGEPPAKPNPPAAPARSPKASKQ